MLLRVESDGLRETRWHEYVSRFVFGGAATALAGLIAKKCGPSLGGLFLAFPAIFSASISLIEKHERERKNSRGVDGTKRGRVLAGVDAAGAAMGTSGLAAFAVTAWALLPHFPLWIVLTTASLAWSATAVTVWIIRKRYRT